MRKYSLIALAIFMMVNFSIAGNYILDKAHSKVGFTVEHMVISTVDGKFNDFEIDLTFDPADLSTFNLKAVIKTASVDTDHEKRDGHLRSNDFFDVEVHPEMTFISSKLEKSDEGYVAHGTLTMRGVSKEIELQFTVKGPISDNRGNSRIGVAASIELNRKDYGVSWSKTMDNGGLIASDEVSVNITAEFKNQK